MSSRRGRPHHLLAPVLLSLCCLLSATLAPRSARAAGFEIPDNGTRAVGRGGAVAVGVSDLTAIHYNPGALAKLRGTRVMWHHNVIFHDMQFTRAPLSEGWGEEYAGKPFDPVQDGESVYALGGFLGLASDLGLDSWTFAAGVYGPSAVGRHDYPDYGPQAFMLTELDTVVLYPSLAVAWQVPETFGVGLTLQWVDLNSMDYEMVVNGTTSIRAEPMEPIPEDARTQLLTKMQLSDHTGYTAILGAWWQPTPYLEIAAASRFLPAKLTPSGGVVVDKPTLVTEELSASMDFELPMQARGGVRYIHRKGDRQLFDIELDVFWERWSSIDAYDMRFDGRISGQELQDVHIPKAWSDTVSVRLGGEYEVVPDVLQVRAGGFWEQGAVPENAEHLDFPSFDRWGAGLGLTATYGAVSLSAGYMHVFQEDREVTEQRGKLYQTRPVRPCPEYCDELSGVVANAGRFESSYDLLSVGLDVGLPDLFR